MLRFAIYCDTYYFHVYQSGNDVSTYAAVCDLVRVKKCECNRRFAFIITHLTFSSSINFLGRFHWSPPVRVLTLRVEDPTRCHQLVTDAFRAA